MEQEILHNLTEQVRLLLTLAKEEAIRLNNNYVGTEHLLLGLIKIRHSVAVTVLVNLGVDLKKIKDEAEKQATTGTNLQQVSVDIPYTPRTKNVIGHAKDEARRLGSCIDTGHILLGILLDGGGIAFNTLNNLGINIEHARKAILREHDPSRATRGELDQSEGSDKIDVATITRLGDRFVGKMLATITGSSTKNSAFSKEEQAPIFFCLNLLLAGGYTFRNMTLEVVLALNACATTTTRLDIVCNIIRRCWTGDKYTSLIDAIQGLYNFTNPDSLPELLVGSLLQRLTGKQPRKVGPELDMLTSRQFVTDEMAGDIYLDVPAPTPETPPPAPPTT